MIPKHPKLDSAKERSIVINVNSIVLNLTFIKKSNKDVKAIILRYHSNNYGKVEKNSSSNFITLANYLISYPGKINNIQ